MLGCTPIKSESLEDETHVSVFLILEPTPHTPSDSYVQLRLRAWGVKSHLPQSLQASQVQRL